MRRLLLLLLVALLLAGCAGTDGPTDQAPRGSSHEPAAGFHTISYHGISLDVPATATVTPLGPCGGGLPATGDYVVPGFLTGAAACPAMRAAPPATPTPRPATALTVLLTTSGGPPPSGLTDPQVRDVAAAGARVVVAGPADVIATVLSSVRVTPQDLNGCFDRIDPNVAPRNIESPDGSLLPVATSRIRLCEYAPMQEQAGRYWLVGSAHLPDDEAMALATRIGASRTPSVSDDLTPFPGPVLRLLVLGADGNTRTLQAPANGITGVTDGQHTVDLADDARGETTSLPTPFDVR